MSAMNSGVRDLLARASERILELFGHDDNVTGVGVGYRRRGGKVTDEPVVTVMVKKKRRPALVSRQRMIPASIDVDGTSCPTDVVQAQAVLMGADETTPELPERYRPMVFGTSISNESDERSEAGTISAFVKDNTDETVGILSANHVIADNNEAPESDPALQPGALDLEERETAEEAVIGRLKRFVTISGGATAVDAAIAQIDEGVSVSRRYGGAEIGPPTQYRPAIGMIVAGDGFGNVWLTNMQTTLRELNVTLLPEEESNVEGPTPAAGSKIEKMGRTTAYTVARVLDTNQSIEVEVPGQGVVTYTGLIKSQWLGWNGDSGAMVMRKSGPEDRDIEGYERESRERIQRLIRAIFDPCEVLPAIQYAFEVPITEDEELSDEVRDEFMSLTDTGRFLITLTYLNTQLIDERLEERQSAENQAYAQALYETYQPIITDLMTNPESTETLDREDGENYFDLLEALYAGGALTAEEAEVAYNLGRAHESAVNGMGRDEVTEYMNQVEVFQSVREATLEMEALVQEGTPRTLGAL